MWIQESEVRHKILTKILSYKKNMNDISLNDIDNLVNCACNRLESKIIKSEIMDGSGHTEDIKLYFYDDAKIGDLECLGDMKDTATKSITEIILFLYSNGLN